ncbi:hypothetical protein DM02DRAFT_158858 [Periconia macrospinosa]|uniref:Uncharacterized protein n=1 Tax=Periconia macrospinosa TaxID=97972 RepID=A0A2V1E5V6_9PLEO|nr:hypothetical protein DM02DRAFT_158858 [Periconia macrospinosa]
MTETNLSTRLPYAAIIRRSRLDIRTWDGFRSACDTGKCKLSWWWWSFFFRAKFLRKCSLMPAFTSAPLWELFVPRYLGNLLDFLVMRINETRKRNPICIYPCVTSEMARKSKM